MRKICSFLVVALVMIGLFNQPTAAAPETFNKNLIIYQDELEDWQSLSIDWIQAFLDGKSGSLNNYSVNGKTAAQIIYNASQEFQINPRVILATIQKESSAITQIKSNYDWILGYGVCDSCEITDPEIQIYKGFENQIKYATAAFRRYLNQIATYGYTRVAAMWGPGRESNILCISSDYDSGRELCTPGTTITIKPLNAATAALYTYTPHPGGNYSFWRIWKMFRFDFARQYPEGTLLRAEGSPNIWLIQSGLKRRFTNSAAFMSRYSFNQVVTVPPDHLLMYKTGREITYANYSLLGSPQGGVYMLVNDLKRPIKTREAFQNAGFRWEEIITISWTELGKYKDGEEITTENIYPSGRLLQNNQTGAVFFVQDGARHPVVCREIYDSQYGLRRPIPVDPAELLKYKETTPIGFKDGEIVTAGSTAYLISQGKKLPIDDPVTFNAYRFSWGNLKLVKEQCLAVHKTGPVLTVHEADSP